MADDPQRESLIGLARRLVRGVIDLGRLELASARQELGEGMGRLGRGFAFIGLAIALLLFALMALVVLLIAIVALWLPWWLSALIWLGVFLAVMALFGFLAYRRIRAAIDRLSIPDTRASVQEDVAWAKRLLRRE